MISAEGTVLLLLANGVLMLPEKSEWIFWFFKA
jgi:hypothetical protein